MKHLERPNVLLIYTDQQRKDSLSCYNPKALTPNLDALAESGARLDNYFVNSPVCMPSRMSTLTGRYCSAIGIGQNGYAFPEDEVPINKLLKPYGYDTAQIGKLHFRPHAKRNHKNPTSDYGFDTFILSDEPGCYDDAYTKWIENLEASKVEAARTGLPPEAYHYGQREYSTKGRETHEPYIFEAEGYHHSDFVTSEVCDYIERSAKKGERFFAIAGFYAPHTPVNPPKAFLDLFDQDQMDMPVRGEDEVVMDILKDVSDQAWQEIIAYYLALVSHVDACVGDIISGLKKTNQLDKTLVIFTSDHGEYLGDHGRIQKGMPHDCIIHVPCIISYPNLIKQGTIIDAMAEAVDIVPTILDICGIQIPEYIQGKTLKRLLTGETSVHKDAIFCEHFDHKQHNISLVRTKTFKYVVWTDGSETLYDLKNDPNELKDVSGLTVYKDTLSKMRFKLLRKLQFSGHKHYEMEAAY